MAKIKKTNKFKKAKTKSKKAKQIKKASSKRRKNLSAKKSAKKKSMAKKISSKKATKKIARKKKVLKNTKQKSITKTVARNEGKILKPVHPLPAFAPVSPVSGPKPEKEKKKRKNDFDDEPELMEEGAYSWNSGSFSDMKNYEPTPVFKKPDPPQPKFKGKKDKRTRYSDRELAEFKEIILEKIKEAERDNALLRNTLAHRDEQGTDDTSPTFKVLEDGSDAMSREEVAQLAARQEKYIQNLKNALVRIENKTYGICRVTGKLIPKERLRSVPHATLSIEAKLMQSS